MHSIRTKLAAVTLTAILISVLTVGTVGILSLKDLGSISSRQILSLLSQFSVHTSANWIYTI